MNLHKKILIILLWSFVLLLSITSLSKENRADVVYIDEKIFKIDSIIPPPPLEGSIANKLELEFIKNKIAKLSDAEKSLATKDALNVKCEFFFRHPFWF